MNWEQVCDIARTFPGVEEGLIFGSPIWRARKRFLVSLLDGGDEVVVQTGRLEQEFLLESQPDIYYITDHYKGTGYLRVRLNAIEPDDFQTMLEAAWRRIAQKRDLKAYDENTVK
jgi:hypothetical protein